MNLKILSLSAASALEQRHTQTHSHESVPSKQQGVWRGQSRVDWAPPVLWLSVWSVRKRMREMVERKRGRAFGGVVGCAGLAEERSGSWGEARTACLNRAAAVMARVFTFNFNRHLPVQPLYNHHHPPLCALRLALVTRWTSEGCQNPLWWSKSATTVMWSEQAPHPPTTTITNEPSLPILPLKMWGVWPKSAACKKESKETRVGEDERGCAVKEIISARGAS